MLRPYKQKEKRARCIGPLRGMRAAQLRASTAKTVNTASLADMPRLFRSSCLQLKTIVVIWVNVAESWTATGILSPPIWLVARRFTLVTSDPELRVQDAGPGRLSRFCSQVFPEMTYVPAGTVKETTLIPWNVSIEATVLRAM